MKRKTMKRTGAAVLTMAMVLSMGAVSMTASAAYSSDLAGASITLTAPQGAFKLYRVATAEKDSDTGAVRYSIDSKFSSVLEYKNGYVVTKTALLSGADAVAVGTSLNDIVSNSAAAEDLAKKLSAKKGDTADDTQTVTSKKATFASEKVNKMGYYLITGSTTGKTQPILVYVDEGRNYALNVKFSDSGVDKVITAIDTTNGIDNQTSTDGKTGIVDKGAKVTYKLTTAFPSYDTDVTTLGDHFTITDIPEESIAIDYSTVKVKINNVNYAYSTEGDDKEFFTNQTGTIAVDGLNPQITTDGKGFKIVFKDSTVLANGGMDVEVTFDATVTTDDSKLDVNTDANDNGVKLTYSNNYFTGKGSVSYEDPTGDPIEEPTEDPDNPKEDTDYARVYCTVMNVDKVDPSDNPVEGARFALYSGAKASVWDSDAKEVKAGAVLVANPVASTPTGATKANRFVFNGLASGTYTLVETAPAGYVGSAPIEIVVTATDEDNTADNIAYAGNFTFTKDGSATADTFSVVNTPKQTLPATGGIGSVLFTVGGALIVLLAGVLFVIYMKKRRVED